MSPETMGWIIAALVAGFGGLLSLIGKFLLDGIRDHLKAVKANTIELALVKQEIKNIMEHSDKIPELAKDINNFYYRVKAVEAQVGIHRNEK